MNTLKDFWPLGMHIPFNPQYINKNAMTIEQYEKAKLICGHIKELSFFKERLSSDNCYVTAPGCDVIDGEREKLIKLYGLKIQTQLMAIAEEKLIKLHEELKEI